MSSEESGKSTERSEESGKSTEGSEKISTTVSLSNMDNTKRQPDKVSQKTEMSIGKELTNQGTEEGSLSDEMANLCIISAEDVETYPSNVFGKCTSSLRMDTTDIAIEQSTGISHEVSRIPMENSTRLAAGNNEHLIHVSQKENVVIQGPKKNPINEAILREDENLEIQKNAATCIPMKYLLENLESAYQKAKRIIDRTLKKYNFFKINFDAVRRLPIWDPSSRSVIEDRGHSSTLVLGDIYMLEAEQLMDDLEVSFGMWEVIFREFNAIKEFVSQHYTICNSSYCYCGKIQEVKMRINKLIIKMDKLVEYRNNKEDVIFLSDEKLREYLPLARDLIPVRNIVSELQECPF